MLVRAPVESPELRRRAHDEKSKRTDGSGEAEPSKTTRVAYRSVQGNDSGMREGTGLQTPLLSPRTSGPARIREIATGVGKRS